MTIEIIYSLLILVMIGVISYLMYEYSVKIKRGRTIRVRNDGTVCTSPLGSLPIIPIKNCETGIGSTTLCYSPPETPGINFSISMIPKYYRSLCLGLCVNVSIRGVCEEENALFDECIALLEPPEGCINTAKPLGRLEGTSNIYYANTILSSQ